MILHGNGAILRKKKINQHNLVKKRIKNFMNEHD